MPKQGERRIALIHDELTRRGGAEIVFEEMIRLWPEADVFTLYAGRSRMTIDGRVYRIKTSFLQRFPLWFRRHPSRVLPLLPVAAEQFDFSEYDLVLSSASGFAKGIVTRAGVPHICYCHTPTRYLWEARPGARWLAGWVLHYMRMVDFAAAQRVSVWIANSDYTRQRIAKYYRRKSEVIYPPVDTGFFTPSPSPAPTVGAGTPPRVSLREIPRSGTGGENYFLCVGRLTRAKGFDQAIRVCEKLGLKLVIAGTGYDQTRLRRLAGKHTRFAGKVSRRKLRDYYRQARAFLQPGVEDFGMAAAEALACGTPVIAYGRGGVKEIVRSRSLGILYKDQSDEALAEAIRQFLEPDRSFSVPELQQSVFRFSRSRWRDAIYRLVDKTLEFS